MSSTHTPATLRRLVEKRANYCCEYCKMSSNLSFFPYEIDHVIPEKHGGQTEQTNLAYTCWRCNRHKGTDLGSFDPQTGKFSFLFNPRTQQWSEHFIHENLSIKGLTSIGRTTVHLLQMNNDNRLQERQRLRSKN